MYFQKLKNGSWRVRETRNYKEYSAIFKYKPTIKEAVLTLGLQEDKPTHNYTMSEASEAYINSKDGSLSASTIYGYQTMLKRLKTKYPQFMKKRLYNIENIDIQNLVNSYAKRTSPKTVRNTYSFIRTVIEMFRDDFRFKISLPQKVKPKMYIPTEEDVKRILEVSKNSEFNIVIKLALFGLRRSEIMALTMQDIGDGVINIDKAKVRIKGGYKIKTTKTYSSTRVVPVSKELTDEIKKKGYICRYSPNKATQYLREIQQDLDMPLFSLHKLRHFWASELAPVLPAQYLKQYGGWNNDFTPNQVYIHPIGDKDYSQVNVDYYNRLTKKESI